MTLRKAVPVPVAFRPSFIGRENWQLVIDDEAPIQLHPWRRDLRLIRDFVVRIGLAILVLGCAVVVVVAALDTLRLPVNVQRTVTLSGVVALVAAMTAAWHAVFIEQRTSKRELGQNLYGLLPLGGAEPPASVQTGKLLHLVHDELCLMDFDDACRFVTLAALGRVTRGHIELVLQANTSRPRFGRLFTP